MRRHCILTVLTVALLIVSLPACTITWRQPRVEPLDRDRKFQANYEDTWSAVQTVIQQFGMDVKEGREEESVGLLDTEFKVLSDVGEEINQLKKVAIVGPGGFIGGRFAVTVTVRGLRSGETRVKIVNRVEGYYNEEFGYQTLRSTGLIEAEMFARIGQQLGTPPVS